jgi:hypothetical protein
MGHTTKGALLVGALAPVLFAIPACGQDESPQKPSENARAQPLDYDIFKSAVQPIFLKHRLGHARCYGCHVLTNRLFILSPSLPARRTGRKNNRERIFKAFRSSSFPAIQNRACFSYTHSQPKRAATLSTLAVANSPLTTMLTS